jgi:hypothetical protein
MIRTRGHDHDDDEGAVELSSVALEARYKAAADPIAKSHFHAPWLLSCGYDVEEVAELLSFSARWVPELIRRYNAGGPQALGDQRVHNGTKPTILTPAALAALKESRRRQTTAVSRYYEGRGVLQVPCLHLGCHLPFAFPASRS